MAVRVISVEIWKFCGGDRERRQVWLDLCRQCQQFTNRVWQEWLVYHVKAGTARKQREFLEAHAAWKRKEIAERPKSPTKAMPKDLSKAIYRTLSDEFTGMNARVRTLLQNKIQQGIASRKAASGSLPGWVSILLGNEGLPSFTKPLPIPFDKGNSKILAPESDGGNWRLEIRLDRDDDTGKSFVDVCELMTRKKKCGSIGATLSKIKSGDVKFCGSSIVFRNGKWFAQICFNDEKESAPIKGDKVAVLRPGTRCPWKLRMNGRSFFRGGFGRHVTSMRYIIARERLARQENYRWASSSGKGHGRNRACDPWTKLSSRWREFQKRYNHEVTTQIVRELVDRGIGKLVYLQPDGDESDTRFLSWSGVNDDRLFGWEYFQVKTLLAYKCQSAGIEFVCVKRGAMRESEPSSVAGGV